MQRQRKCRACSRGRYGTDWKWSIEMKWPSKQATVPFHIAMEDVTAGNPKILKRDFLPNGSLAIVDQGHSGCESKK
jgi:hypothetical protein